MASDIPRGRLAHTKTRDSSLDTLAERALDLAPPTFVRVLDRLRQRRANLMRLDDGELTASERRRIDQLVADVDKQIAAEEAREGRKAAK
jgi:hypothetical protein